ncbi:MAG: hypothetical protein WHU94_14695 [Thermogemmata sp.]
MRSVSRAACLSAFQIGRIQPVVFVLVGAGEGAHRLGQVPAVQPPGPVVEIILPQPPQPFVPVAPQHLKVWSPDSVALQLELATEQGQGLGGNKQVLVLEAQAAGAPSPIATLPAGGM